MLREVCNFPLMTAVTFKGKTERKTKAIVSVHHRSHLSGTQQPCAGPTPAYNYEAGDAPIVHPTETPTCPTNARLYVGDVTRRGHPWPCCLRRVVQLPHVHVSACRSQGACKNPSSDHGRKIQTACRLGTCTKVGATPPLARAVFSRAPNSRSLALSNVARWREALVTK